MPAFLRASSGDDGTNAVMAALKGRSTVGASGEVTTTGMIT